MWITDFNHMQFEIVISIMFALCIDRFLNILQIPLSFFITFVEKKLNSCSVDNLFFPKALK